MTLRRSALDLHQSYLLIEGTSKCSGCEVAAVLCHCGSPQPVDQGYLDYAVGCGIPHSASNIEETSYRKRGVHPGAIEGMESADWREEHSKKPTTDSAIGSTWQAMPCLILRMPTCRDHVQISFKSWLAHIINYRFRNGPEQ